MDYTRSTKKNELTEGSQRSPYFGPLVKRYAGFEAAAINRAVNPKNKMAKSWNKYGNTGKTKANLAFQMAL